jgi:ribosomal protein S18 acetylase RimI-like enzyme
MLTKNVNKSIRFMEIRPASILDAPALSILLQELGFPSSPQEIGERLSVLNDVAFVAVEHGKVIGLITTNIMPVLHRSTSVGRISALIVSEQERGKGIGRALVTKAEQMLKVRGCNLIEVTSNFRLEAAHSFYKSMGYEATSIRFKREL